MNLSPAHSNHSRRDFKLYDASDSTKDNFSANIVSLLQAGCFFGSLLSAPLSDKAGRRLALAIGDVLFIAGSVMQTASLGNQSVMFAGRFVGGLVGWTPRPVLWLKLSNT